MNGLSDKQLIKNYTIFFAYFSHLIESDLADSLEALCEIGWQLDEEIRLRKISDSKIEDFMMNTVLSPEDQLMVYLYIYPDLDLINNKVARA